MKLQCAVVARGRFQSHWFLVPFQSAMATKLCYNGSQKFYFYRWTYLIFSISCLAENPRINRVCLLGGTMSVDAILVRVVTTSWSLVCCIVGNRCALRAPQTKCGSIHIQPPHISPCGGKLAAQDNRSHDHLSCINSIHPPTFKIACQVTFNAKNYIILLSKSEYSLELVGKSLGFWDSSHTPNMCQGWDNWGCVESWWVSSIVFNFQNGCFFFLVFNSF